MMGDWVYCCSRCKKAKVVTDHVAKKKRCSECGLESVYHSIKDGVDVTANDKVRLSDPINPLQSTSGFSKNDSTDDFLSLNLRNSQNPGSDPVTIATTEPNNSSSDDLLSLTLGISHNRASDPVSIETNTSLSDDFLRSDLGNLQKFGFNPLSSVTTKPNKLDLDKAVEFIKLFCSNLGMDSDAVKAAQEAAESSDMINTRSPVSVAAGAVYFISRLSYEKKLLKDIIQFSGVTENTIRETYEDLKNRKLTKDLKILGSP